MHNSRTNSIFVILDAQKCVWHFSYKNILETVGGGAQLFPASPAWRAMVQIFHTLTCLFRSSIIRAIWIFFLPILASFFSSLSPPVFSLGYLRWLSSPRFHLINSCKKKNKKPQWNIVKKVSAQGKKRSGCSINGHPVWARQQFGG